MRPIGIRRITNTDFLKQFGGMVYIYKTKSSGTEWWHLTSGYFTDSRDIIQLKRKVL